MIPTPILIDDTIRVYFGSTDDDMRGRIFYVELDAADPRNIVSDVMGPVLAPGGDGAFDVDGVVPIAMVPNGTALWLYYAGFQRRSDIPYTLLSGLAISTDGGRSFQRAQTEPVLPAIPTERFFRTASHVHRVGGSWSMWYIGGNEWIELEGKKLPLYGLKYATSEDGLTWSPPIDLVNPDRGSGQIGFGRPFVVETESGYRMYISVRSVKGYTLSHARSTDGLQWTDWEHDIIPAGEGWDSEMRCYAAPIAIEGNEYLLYNGNGYGRTGFGLAIRER
jgi:hypothetical protein